MAAPDGQGSWLSSYWTKLTTPGVWLGSTFSDLVADHVELRDNGVSSSVSSLLQGPAGRQQQGAIERSAGDRTDATAGVAPDERVNLETGLPAICSGRATST